MTVAITGSRRASELAHLITIFGGRPYLAPTVGIEARQDISKEAEFFINKILEERVDYVIFMTGPGVYALMSTAKNLGIEKKFAEALQQTTVVARSLKPKIALAKHGIKTDIIPKENTAEGIAKLLKSFSIEDETCSTFTSRDGFIETRLPLGGKGNHSEFSLFIQQALRDRTIQRGAGHFGKCYGIPGLSAVVSESLENRHEIAN